eukprot:gene15761-7057_t
MKTSGNHFRKLDNVAEDAKAQEDEIHILDHLQCSQENACRFIAKSKEDSNKFRRFYTQPDANFQEIWQKDTFKGFKDCTQAFESGITGVSLIDIHLKNGSTIKAVCDMETEAGGWTVFQRRKDSRSSFQKQWKYYKHGFGRLEGSFWLGLNSVFQLTEGNNITLRVDLEDVNGKKGFAVYRNFRIADETNGYRVHLEYSKGNIGDSLGSSNGAMFTTVDRDNDGVPIFNLAQGREGAWWHTKKFSSNLNSLMSKGISSDELGYIRWESWPNSNGLISFTEMKIRREK